MRMWRQDRCFLLSLGLFFSSTFWPEALREGLEHTVRALVRKDLPMPEGRQAPRLRVASVRQAVHHDSASAKGGEVSF